MVCIYYLSYLDYVIYIYIYSLLISIFYNIHNYIYTYIYLYSLRNCVQHNATAIVRMKLGKALGIAGEYEEAIQLLHLAISIDIQNTTGNIKLLIIYIYIYIF